MTHTGTCLCARAKRRRRNKKKKAKGVFLRAGHGWFVLSAKCQSVFAMLSHMISLNTQGLVVHLLRANTPHPHPTPPPLTPIAASPGLEVLAFYLPLRGYEKADKAFHSLLLLSDFWISVILKWLQHVYSGLVAPKQLTWQLNNAMALTENRHSEEFCTSRKDPDSSSCKRTHSHSQATTQHPLKSPKKPRPSCPGFP